MLYRVYQNQADLLSPLRLASQYMARALWQDALVEHLCLCRFLELGRREEQHMVLKAWVL